MLRPATSVVVLFFALMGCSSAEPALPVSPIIYGDSGYLPAKSDAAGLAQEPCRTQAVLEEEGIWPLEQVGALAIESPSPVTQDEVESGVEVVEGIVKEDGSGEVPVFTSASAGGRIFIPFQDGCYSVYEAMAG